VVVPFCVPPTASICVNGVEVHLDSRTPVSEDGADMPLSALAVGKLVAIQASGSGTEFNAHRIAVLNLVVGPVTAVQPAGGTLQVLGQNVVAGPASSIAGIRAGQWVQVSGFRRTGGTIEATFVGTVAPRAMAQLTGPFERNMGVDVVVSGTAVRLNGAKLPDDVGRGSEVTVSGEWDGNTLKARAIESEPTRRSLGTVKEVLVEGLVHTANGQSISLGAQRWALNPKTEVRGGTLRELAPDQRVRVFARMGTDQHMEVRRIDIDRSQRRSQPGSALKNSDDSGGKERKPENLNDDSRSGTTESGSGRTSVESGSGKSSETSGTSSGSGTSGGSGSGGSSGGSGGSGGSGSSGKGSGK